MGMDFSEEYIQWKPASGLTEKYNIESIVTENMGLKTVLFDDRGDERDVQILFKDSVRTYMCADETYRYSLICYLGKKYGIPFYGDWTFFKVTKSDYLDWLLRQSGDIGNKDQLVHYSILAANVILDVIATQEPIVTFVD